MTSFLVISPCYFPSIEPARMMATSAERHGLNPLLYGIGGVMETHSGNIQGTDVIDLLKTRSEQYVLASDCADVLFMAGEHEILTKFLSFNAGLVYSAEKECWPNIASTHEILSKIPGYFQFLNAGLWIGERVYAIHCLSEAIRLYRHNPPDKSCDVDGVQAWMANVLAYGGPEFALDRNCVLFQSMNHINGDVVIEGGRAHNRVTDTWPVALHFNGDKTRTAYTQLFKQLYE